MEVKFIRDVFNAGTKLYEAGRQYAGDLARYVRRGDAVEVKAKGSTETQANTDQAPKPAGAAKGAKGKGKK